jgi:hypothetical protein
VLALCAVGIFLAPETSPLVPGAVQSLKSTVRIPAAVRRLFIGASAIFIACWALAGFYQALAPSLSAVELGHTGSLFAGFAVAALVAPSALGGPLTARIKPPAAMITGSIVLSLGVAGVLISVAEGSAAGFFIASIVAGLAFGAAFHGGMRTLMGGLAPTDRAGVLSGIYLFSYLGAAIGIHRRRADLDLGAVHRYPLLRGARRLPRPGSVHDRDGYRQAPGRRPRQRVLEPTPKETGARAQLPPVGCIFRPGRAPARSQPGSGTRCDHGHLKGER